MRLSIAYGFSVVIAACTCTSAIGGHITRDGVPGDGVPDLIVNVVDLTAHIDTDGLSLTQFGLFSLGKDGIGGSNSPIGAGDGHFNFPLARTFDQHAPGLPTSIFWISNADRAGAALFDPAFFPNGEFTGVITGVINLGQLYRTLPPNLNEDLVFDYVVNGVQGAFNGTLITVVPEPSTVALAILALLGLTTCRRRRQQ